MSEENGNGTEGVFQGFEKPKSNYSKLPHDWFPYIAKMQLSELKVMLYILRHTWGFSEYGKPKRISLDEFANGRWKKDSTRMDCGTGMSKSSVREGLQKAVEHGFLVVVKKRGKNNSPEHSYCLNVLGTNPPSTVVEFGTGVLNSDTPKTEFRYTSVLERNLGKKLGRKSDPEGTDSMCVSGDSPNKSSGNFREGKFSGNSNNGSSGKGNKKVPTSWDLKVAKKLHSIVSSHIKVNAKSNIREWANHIRILREHYEVDKEDIITALKWYSRNIGKEYVVEAFSGKAFKEKFVNGQFKRAFNEDGGDVEEHHNPEIEIQDPKTGKWHKREKLDKYRSEFLRTHGPRMMNQKELNEILEKHGMEPDSISYKAVNQA